MPTYEGIPAEYKRLDFKNAVLCRADLPVITTDDSENYLGDVKPTYENAMPTDVNEAVHNGYLNVSERPADDSKNPYNLFKLSTGAAIEAGKTYFVEFDITAGDCAASTMKIRPTVNVGTTVVNGYINGTEESDLDLKNETKWIMHSFRTLNTVQRFCGVFEATSSTYNLILSINKGDSAQHTSALTIDNIRIYCKETGEDIYVNDFNYEGASNGVTGGNSFYTAEHVLPYNHTLYTPLDSTKPMSVTYDLGLEENELSAGTWTFRAKVKLAEASEKDTTVNIKFSYADGTYTTKEYSISTEWTRISMTKVFEGKANLETVTLTFDTDVPVQLVYPSFRIKLKYGANSRTSESSWCC